MVVHVIDSLRRMLQQFVEYDLAGVVRWDKVRVIIPAKETDVVVIQFEVGPHLFEVSVHSSQAIPPCGAIKLNGHAMGMIDENTWSATAHEIKTRIARAA